MNHSQAWSTCEPAGSGVLPAEAAGVDREASPKRRLWAPWEVPSPPLPPLFFPSP